MKYSCKAAAKHTFETFQHSNISDYSKKLSIESQRSCRFKIDQISAKLLKERTDPSDIFFQQTSHCFGGPANLQLTKK